MEESAFGEKVDWWKKIWKVLGPLKAKTLLWLPLQNCLLTWDNLQRRGWEGSSRCSLCGLASETVSHLFLTCSYAVTIWSKDSQCFSTGHPSMGESLLEGTQRRWSDSGVNIFTAFPSFFVYRIWWARNMSIFNDKPLPF
jgi:hypothetical protein